MRGSRPPSGETPNLAARLQSLAEPNAVVIAAATRRLVGDLFDYRDLGTLEPGKLADLVVLDNNPLDNIRNTTSVRYTVANGRVYDGNMNEVGSRKKARAPFWFEGAAGAGYTAAVTSGVGHVD